MDQNHIKADIDGRRDNDKTNYGSKDAETLIVNNIRSRKQDENNATNRNRGNVAHAAITADIR